MLRGRLTELVLAMLILYATYGRTQDSGRDAGGTAEELLASAGIAFEAGKFDVAEQKLERFYEDFGAEEESAKAAAIHRPFLALCKARLGKPGEALPLLKAALETKLQKPLQEETRFWLGVSQFQATDYRGAQEQWMAYYQKGGASAGRKEDALMLFGLAYLKQEQFPQAEAFFAKASAKAEIAGNQELLGRLRLVQLQVLMQGEEHMKAWELLRRELRSLETHPHPGALQIITFQLGRLFWADGDPQRALSCWQRLLPADRLAALVSNRIKDLETRLEAATQSGDDVLRYRWNNRLRRAKREAADLEKIPDWDGSVRLLRVQAWQKSGRYRQAALVLEDHLDRVVPWDRDLGLNLVHSWMRAGDPVRAIAAIERLLPDSKEATDMLLFLKAQNLQELRRFSEAQSTFREVEDRFAKSTLVPKADFLRGMCLIYEGDNQKAARHFHEYPKRHPKSAGLIESALYWEGMAQGFDGNYGESRDLMGVYLKKHPKGKYRIDAEFRVAYATYGLAQYSEAVKRLEGFATRHPDSAYVNECKILAGDAALAVGRLDEGLTFYSAIPDSDIRFYEEARFKMAKALRIAERFDAMRDHLENFMSQRPESLRLAEAVYWLGWLDQHAGEAEEAEKTYWVALDRYGSNWRNRGVEQVIEGLVKLGKGEPKTRRELQDRAMAARKDGRDTLAVRLAWGHSLALRESEPDRHGIPLLEIRARIRPDLHHARIVADAAESLYEGGYSELAERLYREGVRWNPRRPETPRLLSGLGKLAMGNKDYPSAEEWFGKLVRQFPADSAAGSAQLDLARCKLAVGDVSSAEELLLAALADKSSSSRLKAESLLQLGYLKASQKEDLKAAAYFERVYLSYGKFRDLVTRAYLERARALEKLNLMTAAREVYAECVGRGELVGESSYVDVRKRWLALGGKEVSPE